jgi:hypothetical protein
MSVSAPPYPEKWSPLFLAAFLEAEESWWIGREGDYENPDTWREAREGVEEEVERYRRLKSGGCCGEEDVILEVPFEGVKVRVLYGFNHGH